MLSIESTAVFVWKRGLDKKFTDAVLIRDICTLMKEIQTIESIETKDKREVLYRILSLVATLIEIRGIRDSLSDSKNSL